MPRASLVHLLRWTLAGGLVLANLLATLGCPDPSVWPEDESGFDDHSVGRVADLGEFEALARADEQGRLALKFVIVGFSSKRPTLRLLDSRFFAMHDEWYWFRLLNGQRVPGSNERPQTGSYADVASIVAWARTQPRLPLGMRWVGERLYSDHFYAIALHREQRAFGIGTILYLPARTQAPLRPAIWAMELEYSDLLDRGQLEDYYRVLRTGLPAEIADDLHFIARSPHQDRLVADLRAAKHPLADQLLTYAELAVPGEIEVYNPGLIAGRLRKVPRDPEQAAAMLGEADEDAILLMPAVPDELPSGRGLITAVPQTPLAHVNLLARNRGIPNAYLGGAYDDPNLDQLSRVHAPIVVLAEPGKLELVPITEEEYARYLALQRARPPTLPTIAVDTLDWTLALDKLDIAAMPSLRPIIGGKAAGFLALLEPSSPAQQPTLHRPMPAMAISVRAYAQHLAPLRPMLAKLLADPLFVREARARVLLLEGRKAFGEHFPGEAQAAWLATLERDHDPNAASRDPIAFFLASDGVQKALREQPLDRSAAAPIEQALRTTFASLAPTQGLRFRSSSTIEDIEGFNGAGLYESNTGYLAPELQADAKQRKRDWTWALRKTWASYWGFPAFEERRLAGIDHLGGYMGVLVHPRFDDAIEAANGVVTLTLTPARGDRPATTQMLINVQAGELSVANPPNAEGRVVRPELIRVTAIAGAITIERLASSTELAAGELVIDDARVRELLAVCERITARWHATENAALGLGQRRFSTTLDLEFRVVEPGWPARADGQIEPRRLIVKQARSLEPGLPVGGESLAQQPIPRDLLARATRVDRWQCQGGKTRLDVLELILDPLAYAGTTEADLVREPFVARARVESRGPVQVGVGDHDHLALRSATHGPLDRGRPWSLALELEPAIAGEVGVTVTKIVSEGGLLRLLGPEGRVLVEEPAPCTRSVLLDSPQGFLRALLEKGER